jgi:hypothetical protein
MDIRTAAMLAALGLSLAGCASGPTYADLHSGEPPITVNDGRFYMYRPGSFAGAAIQPSVKIDGVTVGHAIPGGYFYVDEPAGTYVVSATTEKEESVNVSITPGQTRYIRFDISMGVFVGHVSPSIIDPEQGAVEIKACHYAPLKPDGK